MVNFVALLQSPEDRDRVLNCGLVHQHLLEAAFQGGILLDVLPMFIQGGCADAAQLTPGQHRFEQVAGIHGSATGASSHNGVDLVDEQHNLSFGSGDFLEDGLEAFFKFTPVFGSSDQ